MRRFAIAGVWVWVVLQLGVGTADTLWMDTQWVLQGRTIRFDGFFTELLGFSAALVQSMPMMKLVKSSFLDSFDEPYFDSQSNILESLFPKERANLETLLSSNASLANYRPPECRYAEDPNCDDCCDAIASPSTLAWVNSSLSRPLVTAATAADCCRSCMELAHCTAWAFQPESRRCELQGSASPLSVSASTEAVLGSMISRGGAARSRITKPRALILHGTTCIWQNETLTRRRDVNTILIGRLMVERAAFSHGLTMGDYFVASCAATMDELWVPTEWHRAVFAQMLLEYGASTSIFVVPEAVDTELLDRDLLPATPLKECRIGPVGEVTCSRPHRFIFLSIFKWEERKGWDILLRAYFSAFRAEDDVLLILHSFTPTYLQHEFDIAQLVADFARDVFQKSLSELPAVHVVGYLLAPCPHLAADHPFNALVAVRRATAHSTSSMGRGSLSREQVRALYALSDAFVLPSRGEGWGLPIAEAMAMQVPVIATNYSGPTAFITDDNAYPLEVEPHLDALAFAIPREAHLRALLQQVIRDSTTPEPGCAGTGWSGNTEGTRECLSIAQAKARRGRERMQALNATHIVSLMQARLRLHAERRGWRF